MKVRIFKSHTHDDIDHVPGPDGIEIEVTPPEAEFLKQHGVLDKPASAPAPAAVESAKG